MRGFGFTQITTQELNDIKGNHLTFSWFHSKQQRALDWLEAAIFFEKYTNMNELVMKRAEFQAPRMRIKKYRISKNDFETVLKLISK